MAPLRQARRRADRGVRRALDALPNANRLARLPVKKRYTEAEKRTILATQGPRLVALRREADGDVDVAMRRLTSSDRQQLRVFTRLARQQSRRTLIAVEGAWRPPARVPAAGAFPSGAERLLSAGLSPDRNLLAAVAPSAGRLGLLAGAIPAGAAYGTVTNPGDTARGAVELATGAIAAIPELGYGLATRPGDTLERLLTGVQQDLARRYGPLVDGDTGEFFSRVREEGAAPEIVDVLAVLGGGGAVAGRGAGAVARRGGLGEGLRRVATERPGLRTGAGDDAVVQQDVSRNLFRALGQAGEDRLRQRALARRNERSSTGRRGLQPRDGEVVAKSLRSQARLQRRAVSRRQATGFERLRREQAQEIDRGVIKGLSKLTRAQRTAAFHALQGLVRLDDPAAARRQLARRRAQIVEARQRRGVDVPERLRGSNDELAAIDFLLANADRVFTPKLARWQKREAERSQRIDRATAEAGTGVRDFTAEYRRLRPQGEFLGVPDPIRAAERAIDRAYRDGRVPAKRPLLDELERRKPELIDAYARRVRAAARREGLPEPAYFAHEPRPQSGRADRAPGSGNRAVAGPKKSSMSLFETGRANVRHDAYARGTARSIKRRHNWQQVDDLYREHALRLPPRAELRKILRRGNVDPRRLTPEDLRRVLDAMNLDPDDWMFYAPGRLRSSRATRESRDEGRGARAEHAENQAAGLHDAVRDATVSPEAAAADPDRYKGLSGYVLVPKAAHDEIASATQPSGAIGRGIAKAQGIQSRVLLGTSPAWLSMQFAANAFLAGFGTRGNVADLVQAQRWMRSLPKEQRQAIDDYLGHGIFEGHVPKIGAATDNGLVQAWRAFASTPFMQRAGHLNPLDLIFRIDSVQTRTFKRAVLYNQMKRQVYEQMGRDLGRAATAHKRVAGILALPPRERMLRIVRDQRQFEKAAQTTLDIMGDYTRYTARERRTLKRAVLFYGFLRYALRTAFYTLPVKHPIAMALTAELANLHNNEVRELLGGDQAPWAYSRLFLRRDGELWSIDFARANPVTNPIVEIRPDDPSSLLGLASPVAQALGDQLYGTSGFFQRPFTGHGSTRHGSGRDADARWRIFVADLASTAWPVRQWHRAATGGRRTSDDSLPWAPRPIEYRQGAARAREAERLRRQGSVGRQILRDALPLLPRPDNTPEVVAGIQARERGGSRGDPIDRAIDRALQGGAQAQVDRAIDRLLAR